MQPHIDRIEQSRPALRASKQQFVFEIFGGICEIGHQARLVGELDHEKLVLRIGRFAELGHGLMYPIRLAAHTATHVEDNSNGHWGVFVGHTLNNLRLFAFEYLEIGLMKACHEALHAIGDNYGDQYEPGLGFNDVKG